ncbi:ABC transporter ATP-binding protein [Candidatus Saccharibacteria bacterium]|nr:ABC transporter ATP-binding protein [Candidatus Saccharibacteria bacterium]MCA9328413.1 ABC transporter ATP-binding protein [Candidatus Saccharibacteria bacterium]
MKKYKIIYEDSIPSKAFDLFKFMLRPYKGRTIVFFVLVSMGVLSWSIAPVAIRGLINTLSETNQVTRTAWLFVGLYVLVRLTDEWFWRLGEVLMRSYKPQMVERIRTSMFASTLKKPHSFFVNSSSGRLGYWINQTTSTVNDTIDTTIWGVWPRVIALIMSTAFLLLTHWTLALLFLIWLLTLLYVSIKRGREFGRLVEKVSDTRSIASGRVVDVLTNNLSVRVFNARAREEKDLLNDQQHVLRTWRDSWWQHIVTNIYKGHSVALAAAIMFAQVLRLFSSGELSVGDIVLFVAYFSDASSSIWELAWQLDTYYSQFGTIQNALTNLTKDENERELEDRKLVEIPDRVRLELKNLDFVYPEQPNEFVLKKLSVTIDAGQKVGIVGHSGAGKSTLVGLLLGFYEPSDGSILVNDEDTAHHDPSFMRTLSSFVPQDTNLFNRTIRENILYARPNATDEELTEALRQAEALDFVQKLPNGLDTLVGERGVKLSGGQRQRIAIARAILKDAPLLLLDEATSALDSVSEQAIQKALHELMKGRTAIVIAHRLSTLKHLDKILVIEKGNIVEQGSHTELLEKKNGIYADLWKRQKDGFIVE